MLRYLVLACGWCMAGSLVAGEEHGTPRLAVDLSRLQLGDAEQVASPPGNPTKLFDEIQGLVARQQYEVARFNFARLINMDAGVSVGTERSVFLQAYLQYGRMLLLGIGGPDHLERALDMLEGFTIELATTPQEWRVKVLQSQLALDVATKLESLHRASPSQGEPELSGRLAHLTQEFSAWVSTYAAKPKEVVKSHPSRACPSISLVYWNTVALSRQLPLEKAQVEEAIKAFVMALNSCPTAEKPVAIAKYAKLLRTMAQTCLMESETHAALLAYADDLTEGAQP